MPSTLQLRLGLPSPHRPSHHPIAREAPNTSPERARSPSRRWPISPRSSSRSEAIGTSKGRPVPAGLSAPTAKCTSAGHQHAGAISYSGRTQLPPAGYRVRRVRIGDNGSLVPAERNRPFLPVADDRRRPCELCRDPTGGEPRLRSATTASRWLCTTATCLGRRRSRRTSPCSCRRGAPSTRSWASRRAAARPTPARPTSPGWSEEPGSI
jgi:hypothetical protein